MSSHHCERTWALVEELTPSAAATMVSCGASWCMEIARLRAHPAQKSRNLRILAQALDIRQPTSEFGL